MPRVDLFRGGADARKLWEGVCLVVDLVLCRMEAVGVVKEVARLCAETRVLGGIRVTRWW
jgi:hypothetical protein